MNEALQPLNTLDRLIAYVSPSRAAARAWARSWLSDYSRGGYEGAGKGRLLGDWVAGSGSADDELLSNQSLQSLRQRSRDLNRNDPHAAAATSTMTIGVVGDRVRLQAKCRPDGVVLPPVIPESARITEKIAKTANEHAEAAFAQIEQSVDALGASFTEVVELELRQELECGESFVQQVNFDRLGTPLTTGLNVIEPDRIANPWTGTIKLEDGHQLVEGVEKDASGIPVAYWVSRDHPGDTFRLPRSSKFVRVLAKDILHLYHRKRPGQTRGEPWFAPAMAYFRDKAGYQRFEIIAAKVAASFAGFVTTAQPVGTANKLSRTTDASGNRLETMRPGKMTYLRPGQNVEFGNPMRPGNAFAPSMHEILRAIGTALDIPYIVLAKDFQDINYSSARAALIEFRNVIAVRRRRMNERLFIPFWQRLYDEAVLAGMIRAPNYRTRPLAYTRMRPQWPGFAWVDPKREAEADRTALAAGFKTLDSVAAKEGADAEEMLEQIAAEETMRKDLGMPSVLFVPDDRQSGIGDDPGDRSIDAGTNGNGHRSQLAGAAGRLGLLEGGP